MSQVYRELPDGTRIYRAGPAYKPSGKRRNQSRKPDDPRAVRFHGVWLLPLPLLGNHERVMPQTRPDSDAYDHMTKKLPCRCLVCQRPAAERWRRKWRRDRGLQP